MKIIMKIIMKTCILIYLFLYNPIFIERKSIHVRNQTMQ